MPFKGRGFADVTLKCFAVFSALAAMFAGSLLLYNYLSHSPYFEIDRIEVSGAVSLNEGMVRAMTGIPDRMNIFRADLKKIESSIGAHPWIKKVEIKRALPSKLLVRVTERKPKAMINLGDHYLIAEDGSLLQKADAKSLANGLPVIEGWQVKSPAPGQKVADIKLTEAFDIIDIFEEVKPLGELKLKKVGLLGSMDLFFMVGDLKAQFIVSKDDMADELRRLKEISTDAAVGANKWKIVDLSFRNRVVLK